MLSLFGFAQIHAGRHCVCDKLSVPRGPFRVSGRSHPGTRLAGPGNDVKDADIFRLGRADAAGTRVSADASQVSRDVGARSRDATVMGAWETTLYGRASRLMHLGNGPSASRDRGERSWRHLDLESIG